MTQPGLSTGRALWSLPRTSDNSQGTVQLTATADSGDLFPFPGPTTVMYTATDLYGNYATCTFNIFVAGKLLGDPPLYVHCPHT